jgi:hypothetical protein
MNFETNINGGQNTGRSGSARRSRNAKDAADKNIKEAAWKANSKRETDEANRKNKAALQQQKDEEEIPYRMLWDRLIAKLKESHPRYII